MKYLKSGPPRTIAELATYLGVPKNIIDVDLKALRALNEPIRISGYEFISRGPAKKRYSWGSEPDESKPKSKASLKKRVSKPRILQKIDGPAPPGIDDDEFERQRLEMLREIARTHVPKRDPLFAMYSKPQPEKEST